VNPSASAAADLSSAIASAIESARAADLDTFADASNRLMTLNIERVGIVQATAIRSLLEELYYDGLDADDVRAVLTRCAQASAWFPDFDAEKLLLVLSGALGTVDPEQQPQAGRDTMAAHATLVMADLSSTRPAMLTEHLSRAIEEIRRAETIEMP
jgi:hypothetical protein